MSESIYYILCILLCFFSTILLQYVFQKPNYKKKLFHGRRLPPSPPYSLPLIGHLHYFFFSSSLCQSFHNLSSRYGSLIFLRLGAVRCMVVSSASLAAEVYKNQDLIFSYRPPFAFGDELPYSTSGFFIAEYGVYWKFMKKLTVTELLSQRQLERTRAVRFEETSKLLRGLIRSASKKEPVDLSAELMKVTNNSICRMMMSTRCSGENDEAEKIKSLVKETFEMAKKLSMGDVFGWPFERLAFWLFGRQAMDVTMRYDEILEKALREHEERGNQEGLEREDRDLMDILLKVYQDQNAEVKITRTNIKAYLLDLFLGGTATSTDVTSWAMAELINHPHTFNKLRQEINSVIGTTRLVKEDDLPNLSYLQAVIKETLRLYPANPISMRSVREDCKIDDYDISKNTTIAVNLFGIMRDPKVWENPSEFNPERFTGDVQYDYKGYQNFEFVPFGGGRRACPGSTLAFSFISYVIAVIVQCFDWKIGRDGNESKVHMEFASSASLSMAKPLLCIPVVRFNPFASAN